MFPRKKTKIHKISDQKISNEQNKARKATKNKTKNK